MLPMDVRRIGRSGLDTFQREMDRWYDRWLGNDAGETLVGSYPVDIHEDDNHLYVEAEMPGFSKDQINVTLEKGMLTICGERKEQPDKGEPHLKERRFTRVCRRFSLPNTVDENKVDASLSDGVLHLKLHKREEVKPRRIEVK